MGTTKIREVLNSKRIECAVCNSEFSQIARQITCESKECRQINTMLNLKSKLRNSKTTFKNLREYWFYSHIRNLMYKYDDYDRFKLRLEALEDWCKNATLMEIAKDVQQIVNGMSNKRI